MPLLKVIVNRLNKRKGPVADFSDKSNIVGVVNKDFIFEGDEVTNLPAGLGKWYKDRDGHFYWGGGVASFEVASDALSIINPAIRDQANELTKDFQNSIKSENEKYSDKISYAHIQLEIPLLWNLLGTKGEEVRVAVVDTGIDKDHPDLKTVEGISLVSEDSSDFDDFSGHGTNCAGLIGAKGNHVFGVAPACELYGIKILQGKRFKISDNPFKLFESAFRHIIELNKNPAKKIDILSISLGIDTFEASQILHLDSLIEQIASDSIVLVSVGDDGNSFETRFFPAISNHVVCVGAANRSLDVLPSSMLHRKLAFLSPGDKLLATDLINISPECEFSDSSAATAFAAGVFALLQSYNRKKSNYSNEKLMRLVIDNCLVPDMPDKNLFGSGLLYPLKSFLNYDNTNV